MPSSQSLFPKHFSGNCHSLYQTQHPQASPIEVAKSATGFKNERAALIKKQGDIEVALINKRAVLALRDWSSQLKSVTDFVLHHFNINISMDIDDNYQQASCYAYNNDAKQEHPRLSSMEEPEFTQILVKVDQWSPHVLNIKESSKSLECMKMWETGV
ncbi:hypothetical protein BJ741DRAFT_655138 [Chytriomyces cf. hyalinus JEL632]|nr:hypothetical protein BJ741DRAFT_655138 [Chytriomyces cf. hyalinus JEL632]